MSGAGAWRRRRACLAAALAFALGAPAATAPRAAPLPLFIEAELVPARAYVGGEVHLRLRVFRAPGVGHGVLRAPVLGEDAEMSLLGPILTYETGREGVTYAVLERTHVLVPRRAGRFLVPGASFEAETRYAEVFGRDAPGTRTAELPLAAFGPRLELEVRTPPAGASEPWLPARSVTLAQTWSRDLDALATGTPLTRTIVLRAEGLAAERLPRLEMGAHPALVLHHDQPELVTEYLATGIVGRRVQRIVLMPVAAAEVALPALTVRWWDVGADAARSVTLPARSLRLHEAIAPMAEVSAAPRAAPAAASAPAMLRVLLLAIVAFVVAALWWQRRTRAPRLARRRLRAACRGNVARAARDALLEWGRAVDPASVPTIMQRCGAGWPDAARAQLAALDAALYAGRDWDGAAFWHAVRPCLRARRPRSAARATLPPLFRLQSRADALIRTASRASS